MTARQLILKGGIAVLLTTAAVVCAVTPASAHTPYIVPTTFAPERDVVAVQGGMSEENAFIPDFGLRGDGDWSVTGPDGVTTPAKPANFKAITILEASVPTAGTYRISTGERPGRGGKAAKVDGVWRSVRPAPPAGAPAAPAGPARMERGEGEGARGPGPINAADVPAGAETIDTQGFQIAETYVSKGAPSAAALKPRGKGFEIEPITHPNEIFLDDGFTFRALVDGKPVAGLQVAVHRGGELYDAGRTMIEATTGADGKATIKFAKAGAYMLETRYPGQSAPGAAPAARSWTYTLSFEVTQ